MTRRRMSRALPCCARAKRLGDEHPTVLTELHNLALMLGYDEEIREESRRLGQRTLKSKKRIFGIDHYETLISVVNLTLTPHEY